MTTPPIATPPELSTADVAITETRSFSVPIGPGQSATLEIDAEGITWRSIALRYDEILAVRYAIRAEGASRWQERLVRRVMAHGPATTLELELCGSDVGEINAARQADAYYSITDAFHHHVEPRLRAELLARVQRGDRVDIGPVSITADGLLVPTHGGNRSLISWQRLPSAHFERAQVVVSAHSPRGTAVVAEVAMLTPNAVLVPDLLNDAITQLV